ncbi:MAG TPA: FkbM family methyltransferase [Caldilineaceae bacterium]|nr:FkbM family methyltransferase [Caldilineaceae bacterium]
MNFLHTLTVFHRQRFTNPYLASARHIAWQVRKIFNQFPCVLHVERLRVEIGNKTVANGCGALLNALGYYDPNNMRFVEDLARRGAFQTFLDIGANIGIYSLIVAQAPTTLVHAFEPHPDTYRMLNTNIRLNCFEDRIRSYALALSNQEGVLQFLDVPGNAVNRLVENPSPEQATVPVQVVSGEHFCTREGITPEIMKIDVEGHELSVLRGFGPVLGEARLLLVEIKKSKHEVCELLKAYHFQGPFKVDFRRRTLSPTFQSYEDDVFVHAGAEDLLHRHGYQIDREA